MFSALCRYDDGTKQEYAYSVDEFINSFKYGNMSTVKTYIAIPATFDIETSTIQTGYNEHGDPEYKAFMYHFQFCIETHVIFGRTWAEFLRMLEHLKTFYQLDKSRKLVIYVHNLSYEFQFLYRYVTINSVFRTDAHKILKCVFNDVFEMRCSYYLSNMNLAKFIENTPDRHHFKAVNDLDYRALRTPETPLTSTELGYCYNDVAGLYEAVTYLLNDDDVSTIPLTSTGYVRRDCRNAMRKNPRNYRQFQKMRLNSYTYQLCKECFRGGNTASNRYNANMILKNVNSYDISSSYPFAMISEKYPAGKFMYIELADIDELLYYNNKFCTIGRYTFVNIKLKQNMPIPYIPFSKCTACDKPNNYNGRILSARRLCIGLTNIDYEIIAAQYEFDELYVNDFHVRRKDYLPIELREQILKYFTDKSKLKGVAGKEYEYTKAKNRLNGIYGMCVTDIQHAIYDFDENSGGFTEKPPDDITDYYKNRNNFLSYQWGIFVTAYARRNLQRAIDAIGLDVVYVDTDSVKYVGDHENAFTALNSAICGDCSDKLIKHSIIYNDKQYYLGIWDHDAVYDRFITLGAKKYRYEIGGHIGVTVSGLNKKQGRQELKEIGGLDMFKIGTIFYNSGRTVRYYNNDNIGNITVAGVTFSSASNIAIVDTTYTLGITDTMMSILLSVQNIKKDGNNNGY